MRASKIHILSCFCYASFTNTTATARWGGITRILRISCSSSCENHCRGLECKLLPSGVSQSGRDASLWNRAATGSGSQITGWQLICKCLRTVAVHMICHQLRSSPRGCIKQHTSKKTHQPNRRSKRSQHWRLHTQDQWLLGSPDWRPVINGPCQQPLPSACAGTVWFLTIGWLQWYDRTGAGGW